MIVLKGTLVKVAHSQFLRAFEILEVKSAGGKNYV